ncbi:HWE histidine kinase domain-containing protein [Rhizobium sp. RU36D]|uniref:sensor histidine kinase n=1 Tax=Rhizobium sp. RU36D TaxID=1907415 RepID=UPI0009D880C5|nr:HWE histidine kinase domain-containing protein [Rhizobium sp. RU36D]SMC99548.1 Two-component sensor histidine kinase, contains HisKA and HATPase domains [Rhizobium sp. RU36D]
MQDRDGSQPRILLLEDSSVDAELIETQLDACDPPALVTRVATRAAYAQALEQQKFDIILSDFSLPDFDGMGALEMAVARAPNIPFIFVSGVLGEEAAIEAFRKGATDYILKQRLIRLPAAVERALKETRNRRERRRAEEQKDLLVRELSHRVKNNLAVILSLVRRTAADNISVESYRAKLIDRIGALAEAHSLLFERNWADTDLLSIFRRAVTPYDSDPSRIDIGQHDLVTLNPANALSVGMIFNELVTNASKYGALSNEVGRVAVEWYVESGDDGKRWLHLRWVESGGPIVAAPGHQGFGSRLIRANVEYELDGRVVVDYPPEGALVTLSFPLENRQSSSPI